MMRLLKWLDERTGLIRALESLLFMQIPGGTLWRHTWGNLLVFMFTVQTITGLALWMGYSPGVRTAWESVYYIQHVMPLGWLVRGIHYYTAEVMLVMAILHVIQMVWFRSYHKPRELNFYLALATALLVVGFSLTGFLLPWDEQGYWSAKVRTHIMSLTPLLGGMLKEITIGGHAFGHHTLTRFFALHAGVLPLVFLGILGIRMVLMRHQWKQSTQPEETSDPRTSPIWPDLAARYALAALVIMAGVLCVTFWPQWFGFMHKGIGAPLTAPADPSDLFASARPEWYFLFLFQFLKYFPGTLEVVGAIVIPSAVFIYLLAMPWLGNHRIGHSLNVLICTLLISGMIWLTWEAKRSDAANTQFVRAQAEALMKANRTIELASSPGGIPAEGALHLLHTDPMIQGPRLFAQHCAGCHRYDGHDGKGTLPEEAPSAPDLKGFASRHWIGNLLNPEHIATEAFFGNTAFNDGKMVSFVQEKIGTFDAEKQAALMQVVKILSSEARLKKQAILDSKEISLSGQDREAPLYDAGCLDCHAFHFEDEDVEGPDLTGYGSREWMMAFVSNPSGERFYGQENDRMPAFLDEGILTEQEIGLVVDWLRDDWFNPVNP
jgi:ubiquinol-cytochrome c reductase cytochrome b subunit